MSVKLPSGISGRIVDGRRQYRAAVSDRSQRLPSGRPRQVCSRWFDRLEEAREWREDQVVRLRTVGTIARDVRTTIDDATRSWIDLARRIGVDGRNPIESATADRYASTHVNVIGPTIGATRIADVTTPMLVRWRDETAQDHGRDATIRALALLKQVMRYQSTVGAIPMDVSSSVRMARGGRQEADDDQEGTVDAFMSPGDVERLLRAVDDLAEGRQLSGFALPSFQVAQRAQAWVWARPLVYMLVLGGLRMGEASALRWSDVDWSDGTISVRRARKRDGSIGRPKNASSIRTVKMGTEFMSILRTLWTSRNDWADDDYVYGGDPGKPLNPGNFGRRQWKDAVTIAELVEEDGGNMWTPHDCRHYHASVLILAGVNVQLVADRLGHANSMVTQTVYAHLFKELAGRANTAGADLENVLLGRRV